MSRLETWARLIETYDGIPDEFANSFKAVFKPDAAFPYVIFSPEDRWVGRKTAPRLTCYDGNRLVMMESAHNQITTLTMDIKDVCHIQQGTVLLHSWLKVAGLSQGKWVTISMEFNTVVIKLFEHIIQELRLGVGGFETISKEDKVNGRKELIHLGDYKFKNFANASLIDGENLVCSVFQLEIRTKKRRIFNKIVSSAHLHMLTPKELIIISEGKANSSRFNRYEDIWTYIPVKNIKSIEINGRMEGMFEIAITLASHDTLYYTFCSDNEDGVKTLIKEYIKIRNKKSEYAV